VAQVHDVDRNALGDKRYGQRRHNESGLHVVRDERFLDFGKALEHAGQEDFAASGKF
jgi:hypothetical protein